MIHRGKPCSPFCLGQSPHAPRWFWPQSPNSSGLWSPPGPIPRPHWPSCSVALIVSFLFTWTPRGIKCKLLHLPFKGFHSWPDDMCLKHCMSCFPLLLISALGGSFGRGWIQTPHPAACVALRDCPNLQACLSCFVPLLYAPEPRLSS